MINQSYTNGSCIINKYNISSVNNNNNSTSNNLNFSSIIHIKSSTYKINLSDIYYNSNLCYIVDVPTDIYLPDTSTNPYYSNINFKLINALTNTIYIHSPSDSLMYSTFFNSVQGDNSMAIHGNRMIQVNSTVNIDKVYSWMISIN